MNQSFVQGAEAEYLEAIRFFEDQRAGLGAELIAEVERTLSQAAERPRSWRLVHPAGISRIGLKRFPSAVFFRVLTDGRLQVTAFAHHRRRPGYWLKRVGAGSHSD